MICKLINIVACKVNYHHNYRVEKRINEIGKEDHRRIYYDGPIPSIIQVGEHQFVEQKVITFWITSMVLSWTSATNCTRLYNSALSRNRQPPNGWSFGFTLSTKHVYNGFTILCLLEDLHGWKRVLDVPHSGSDNERYKTATQERNQRMRLSSQPGTLRHHCDKCVRFIGNRSVSVVVIDGITLGHPCCAMHNCHIPLSNNRNRFCDSHVQHSSICAIVSCSSPVAAPERKTCDHPDHHAVELMHIERGQSQFQL